MVSHARGSLPPLFSWDAASIRKGNRIKQKQCTHGAVASSLVSPSLSQNIREVSRKVAGEGSATCCRPRDHIRAGRSAGRLRVRALSHGRGVGSACEDRPCKTVWRARPLGDLHAPRQPYHTACTTL